jgi:predicted CXXCH cytochrome family protein
MLKGAEGQPQHEPFKAGDCDTCHQPHASETPRLLKAAEGALCRSCHDVPTAAPAGGSLHAAARDRCTGCHQPHASATAHLLLAPVRPLCVTCHEEVGERLEKETVHPPAGKDDGCLGCHRPHAAGEPHLLQASVSKTCLACHDGTTPRFAEKHLGFPAEGMNCGECHDPHASRMAGMLLPETHSPFAGGDCTTCHKGARPTQGGER